MLTWGQLAAGPMAHPADSACSAHPGPPQPKLSEATGPRWGYGPSLKGLCCWLWAWMSVWAVWVGPRLLPLLMASPVPTVRLHDSISEEGFHYLVFDL